MAMTPGVPRIECISQFIRFARASSKHSASNCRNKALTAQLLAIVTRFQSLIADTAGWKKNIMLA